MNKAEQIRSNISFLKRKGLSARMDNFELLALTVPALLYFFIFHYTPMFGIIIAFKNYSYSLGIFRSEWIGLKNFEFFFTSQDAWRVTRNTVCYSAANIVLGIVVPVFIALLLYELRSRTLIKIYQTIMILPHFMSWVIVGFITYALLDPRLGVFNQILTALSIEGIQWYSTPRIWPFILLGTNIWKTVGMNTIVYYAALMGADQELYDAAAIDGATRWKQTLHISIPILIPLMTILSILAVGSLFRGDFGLFYQIPRDVGVLYPVTDVIDTYIFRGLRGGDIGATAAVGLFQSFVGLVLVVGTNFIVNKIDSERSLF